MGDAGVEGLARLTNLSSLNLMENQIGDAGAEALGRLSGLTSLDLSNSQIGATGAEALARLSALTSLNLSGNHIGDAGAKALARLSSLRWLDLWRNQIGDAGAEALSRLSGLTSLALGGNRIGDAGAEALARLSGLTLLDLEGNQIGDTGAEALSQLNGLTSLHLGGNRIGDAGAEALSRLSGLTSLALENNRIGDAGGRALLDAWANPGTSGRRRELDLRANDRLKGLLPAEVLEQTDAQVIIAAWRRRQREGVGEQPLPEPEAAGAPSPAGLRVSVGDDGRLRSENAPLAEEARDDQIGRELHAEVIEALDRLIVAAGRSNTVAEWREAAEGAKERLGAEPSEVRVSALLRIERLRGLREADERRRQEPDPLVQPAEAGVAAALGDAVAAANLYVQTDPYLAEQQQRLADPGMKLELTVEEAAAVEADLEELDVAEPELLDELRQGRETAVLGGAAGQRAGIWLAGSWRNVFREVIRQVIVAARAAAKGAKLGASVTVKQAANLLREIGLFGNRAARAAGRAAATGAAHAGRAYAIAVGTAAGTGTVVGMIAFLEHNYGLLTKLGWSADFMAKIASLIGL